MVCGQCPPYALITVKAIDVLQGLADCSPNGRVKRMADEGVQKVQKKIGNEANQFSLSRWRSLSPRRNSR